MDSIDRSMLAYNEAEKARQLESRQAATAVDIVVREHPDNKLYPVLGEAWRDETAHMDMKRLFADLLAENAKNNRELRDKVTSLEASHSSLEASHSLLKASYAEDKLKFYGREIVMALELEVSMGLNAKNLLKIQDPVQRVAGR